MNQTIAPTALIPNSLPVPSALGSLEAYVGAVHQIPVLSAEDEQALARRFHEQNDLDAARELVLSHLRFVVHVARGYNGYGLQLADLIQEKTQPDGLALVMEASHYCMAWRGVKDMDSKMINSVMRGVFLKDPNLRREFLSLIPR